MSDVKRVRRGRVRGHEIEKKRTSIKASEHINEKHTDIFDIKKEDYQELETKLKEKEDKDIVSKKIVKSEERERSLRKKEVFYGQKYPRIRSRKIRGVDFNRDEQKLDQEVENGDNFSVSVMILILVVCFVVGIVLGYLLYRLAIDSSAIVMIGKSFLL